MIINNYSAACAVELEHTVVVTGGYDMVNFSPLATVQVYDNEGPREQLPDLIASRSYHACAHYVDSENRVVSIDNIHVKIIKELLCLYYRSIW